MSEEDLQPIKLKEDDYEIMFTELKSDITQELISINQKKMQPKIQFKNCGRMKNMKVQAKVNGNASQVDIYVLPQAMILE